MLDSTDHCAVSQGLDGLTARGTFPVSWFSVGPIALLLHPWWIPNAVHLKVSPTLLKLSYTSDNRLAFVRAGGLFLAVHAQCPHSDLTVRFVG